MTHRKKKLNNVEVVLVMLMLFRLNFLQLNGIKLQPQWVKRLLLVCKRTAFKLLISSYST